MFLVDKGHSIQLRQFDRFQRSLERLGRRGIPRPEGVNEGARVSQPWFSRHGHAGYAEAAYSVVCFLKKWAANGAA
ncbi:MAG TPA: hypothetical protein VNY84_10240, partial [Acidimicrobiales bacterium]|nr:hypothetical protein [Acidimicrobiales bacterium]